MYNTDYKNKQLFIKTMWFFRKCIVFNFQKHLTVFYSKVTYHVMFTVFNCKFVLYNFLQILYVINFKW